MAPDGFYSDAFFVETAGESTLRTYGFGKESSL